LMSASGLPGRRVEAMRAGITTMGFIGLGDSEGLGDSTGLDFLVMSCRICALGPMKAGLGVSEVG
jgi:hypothetical protein